MVDFCHFGGGGDAVTVYQKYKNKHCFDHTIYQ